MDAGMLSMHVNNRRSGSKTRAFTLIELLVVVSIIALLISILMPSLKAAREQAKVVVCMANLKNTSAANAVYHSRFNDYLVGAPGTSGAAILRHPDRTSWSSPPYKYLPVTNGEAVKMLQGWDWATPLDLLDSVPQGRNEYYRLLFDRFRCSKNNFLGMPVIDNGVTAGGEDWPASRIPSYYTVRQMLVWPNNSGRAPFTAAEAGSARVGGEGEHWFLPRGYSPRMDKIGQPSTKIFLCDGSRWTDRVTGEVTYNIDWNSSAGGCFSTGGAALKDGESSQRNWLRDFFFPYGQTAVAAPVTYRHIKSGKLGITAAFYDGHAAYLSEPESRHPDFWWPKGTLVTRGELNNPATTMILQQIQPYAESTGYKVK